MSSTGQTLQVRHEIDGLTNIQFLRRFYNQYTDSNTNFEQFTRISDIIETSTALTISIYLHLGEEVDFGVSFHAPMNTKELSRHLRDCPDQETVERWLHDHNNPIATSVAFS